MQARLDRYASASRPLLGGGGEPGSQRQRLMKLGKEEGPPQHSPTGRRVLASPA